MTISAFHGPGSVKMARTHPWEGKFLGGGGEVAKSWPVCHTCRKELGDKYPQVRPVLELLRRY